MHGPTATEKDRDDTVVGVRPSATEDRSHTSTPRESTWILVLAPILAHQISGFPPVRLGRVLGYLGGRAGIRDTLDNESRLINGQTISHRCSGEVYLDSCRER